MDSARFIQLFLIALFSAAVALIGLNELSHRFIRSGTKDSARELVRDLHGEVDIVRPLAAKPTPEGGQAPSQPKVTTESAYGAVQGGWRRLMDKLLP